MSAECWLRDTHSPLTSVVRSQLSTSLTDMTYWSLNFIHDPPPPAKKSPCLLGFYYLVSSGDFPQTTELTVPKVKSVKLLSWRMGCAGVRGSTGEAVGRHPLSGEAQTTRLNGWGRTYCLSHEVCQVCETQTLVLLSICASHGRTQHSDPTALTWN